MSRNRFAPDEKAPTGQINAVRTGKTAVRSTSQIILEEQGRRQPTGFGSLTEFLEAGIVKGSLVLVGRSGNGKSTLLQVCGNSSRGRKRCPIFPEKEIVKARSRISANRMGRFREILVFFMRQISKTQSTARWSAKQCGDHRLDPNNVPGRYLVGTWKRRVRESTNLLMQNGKGDTDGEVGHVTKEGVVADTVCWNIWWIRFCC